jgi:hypothetical protein
MIGTAVAGNATVTGGGSAAPAGATVVLLTLAAGQFLMSVVRLSLPASRRSSPDRRPSRRSAGRPISKR